MRVTPAISETRLVAGQVSGVKSVHDNLIVKSAVVNRSARGFPKGHKNWSQNRRNVGSEPAIHGGSGKNLPEVSVDCSLHARSRSEGGKEEVRRCCPSCEAERCKGALRSTDQAFGDIALLFRSRLVDRFSSDAVEPTASRGDRR